jgi:hypothetical protein
MATFTKVAIDARLRALTSKLTWRMLAYVYCQAFLLLQEK